MKIGTSTVTAIYLGTTSIVSAYLGATQVFGGASAFTPLDLFSTGAQGVWYDPSDLTTMFVDRAGTTPVTTPGTVVGLRLDKSKGLTLGSELVTNGGFATDTDWTKGTGWTIGGGEAVATAVASGQSVSQPIAAMTAGKSYRLTLTISSISGGIRPYAGSGGGYGTTVSTSGTYSWTLLAGGTGGIYIATAGTTTATIDNISVRELAGNHATAPTDAARPTYGVEPKGGRRNLLTYSEQFDVTWSNASGTLNVTANATTAPDGTLSADKLVPAAATAYFAKRQAVFTSVIGASYSFSAYAKEGDAGVHLELISYNAASPIPAAVFNLSTGAVLASRGCTTSVGAADAYGFRRYSITFTATAAAASITDLKLTESSSLEQNMTGNGSKGLFAWGAQLEASTLSAYQRVLSAYDVTESGVATCHYVQYDGSDDSMSTSAIDFTGTDKMSVFAGVRKLSDAAFGCIAEFGPNSGSQNDFGVFVNTGGTGKYYLLAGGGGGALMDGTTNTATTVPNSDVLTVQVDRPGSTPAARVIARIDGAASTIAFGSTDLLAGNFGNYPMFFGRRNNATFPFNGKDYGIVIVGKTASAGEVTDTETWLAAKTAQVTI